MFVIETQNLTKYYSKGKVQALEDFTIAVESGKIFSLLGPNGAGKTTLIKLLLGIIFPTRGTGSLFGKSIKDNHLHKKLGYLAENHRFPDFLNPRQILLYYGKMAGVPKHTIMEKTPQLLKLVNLEEWEGVKIRKFSKGMLQRLGIAQALINDPKLLFMDEPTDGIDPVGRKEIRDILMKLRERGKTIFLNSHLLSEVERISDQIAILKNGKLLQKGNVQDFISVKDKYQLKLKNTPEYFHKLCKEMNVETAMRNGAYLISVNDTQHLNRLIDQLRNRKTVIEAIIPHKITLEDFFIEVIGETKQG